MKLLPYILVNVAIVVLALVVYEDLRAEDPVPTHIPGATGLDAVAIERRLAALEAVRQPLLRAEGTPPALLARLDDLEARLEASVASRAGAPASTDAPEDTRVPLARVEGSGEEPTPEAVATFRRLQDAAHREERRLRELKRVDTLLAKHDIALDAKQRENVVAVHAAFEARRNEVWTEVKTRASTAGASVDWKTIIRDTNVQLERELGERLARVLPAADAEAVARALSPATK